MKDRACTLRLLRRKLDTSVLSAYHRCLALSPEFQHCKDIVSKKVPGPRVVEICAVPNFEIRSCLIEKFMAEPFEPVYPSYRTLCEAEFLTNLLKPLEGSAHGAGCELLR